MSPALIIEADPRLAIRLATILAARSLPAVVLTDPEQAVARVRADAPALVLLRVELPGTSGFSVCNRLRRDDDTRAIPLILYASDVSPEVFDGHSKLRTRASAYLHVPFDPARVLAAVAACLPASA
ncbi:response regulator [Nannocystis punicea]|uniref:Response regulator n=1 Tax=Nannocystis punicea TaxID=2995304 RepID=A0ABY7HEJ3_9BACT|nr:response regulator [Nannocystis poenicansa]WAS97703.1 response regulator [Nannocystis poenicansa]